MAGAAVTEGTAVIGDTAVTGSAAVTGGAAVIGDTAVTIATVHHRHRETHYTRLAGQSAYLPRVSSKLVSRTQEFTYHAADAVHGVGATHRGILRASIHSV